MRISTSLRFGVIVLGLPLLAGCSREAKQQRLLTRAHSYFAGGDYESARIEFQNVLQADPKNLAALEHLGRVWLERGAPMRALPYFLEVLALRPDDREIRLKTLQIALGSGKLDEARRGAFDLLARWSGNPDALLLLSETVRSPEDQNVLRLALREFPDRNVAAFHLATANLALNQGNHAAAKTSLQRALLLEPKLPAAHAAMAAYHLAHHDLALAGEALAAAADLAPLRSNDRLRLFEFQARYGTTADAVAGLRALVAKVPDYLPAWRCLAQLALQEKHYDETLRHLQAIFDRDPVNYEARLLRAQLRSTQGDPANALAELEGLVADFPGLAAPRYALAQAHLQQRDPARALAALQQAVMQNPDHEQANLLLAALHLRAGEAQTAVHALVDLLTRRPNLEPAQQLLIDALGALGRLDDIARLARASLAASPDQPRSHLLLGLVLARQGRLAEARQHLEKSLELAPGALPVIAELVRLDLKEGNVAAARQRVDPQLAEHPDFPAVQLLDARIHAAQQHWDAAETALLRVLALDPHSTLAYDLLTSCYVAQKDTPAATARLTAFLAARPDQPGALRLAGNVYLHWGAFAQARDAYEKHLADKPDTISVLNNLAYIYSDPLPDLDRALALARRARGFEPYSADVADTLGWILFKRQDYPGALALLRESAAKRPNDPSIQAHLAAVTQVVAAQRRSD